MCTVIFFFFQFPVIYVVYWNRDLWCIGISLSKRDKCDTFPPKSANILFHSMQQMLVSEETPEKNDVLHNVAIVSMLPHMLSGMQYYRSAKILPVAVSCLIPKRPFRIPYCLCFIICAQKSWFGFCLMDAKFSKAIVVSVVCFILSTILLVYFAVCSFFFRLCFCWFALEELRPNPKNATYIGKVLS